MVSDASFHSFLVLAIGFGVAGFLASGYQLLTARPASFGLLGQPARSAALASIPFLVFAAPFIIMRNTVRGRQLEQRNFLFAMLATIIAGCWSLMSGTVVVTVLEAFGF